MSIKENLSTIKSSFLDPDCTLVAVSKTKPVEAIQEAYAAGIRDFGENKVQELMEKAPQLPSDIRWHMIGHLQRNKVKYLVDTVHLIHGVDSMRLLREIEKQAAKVGRVLQVLLQVHIAEEDSKFGFDAEELQEALLSEELAACRHVKVCGLMGMATFTEDEAQVSREFEGLKRLFDRCKSLSLPEHVQLETLSMGMSGDYLLAQKAGSTMVRIGSAIFGARA